MMCIKMHEQDYKNLQAFLARVNLTGKESLAYVSIIQALSNAEPLEVEKNKEDEEDKKEVK